jgi:hypothetical protein
MILTPNRCSATFFPPSEAQTAAGSAAVASSMPKAPAAVQAVEHPYPGGAPHAVATPLNTALVARVLAEYREMPGLLLTLPQACRLWNTDLATVRVVLELLVARGSLRQSGATYLLADFGRRCAS